MKTIFTTICTLVISVSLMAQSYTPAVKLTAGKKYDIVSVIDGNMSQEVMGQSMEIPMQSTSNSLLEIKQVNDKGYQSDYTTNRLKFSMNAMGQEMSYDSDKKEDREGKMGANMNKMVGTTTSFTVNNSGNILAETVVKPKMEASDDEGDMMGSMLSNMGLKNMGECPAFNLFTNTNEIKIGNSFTDTSSTEGKDGKTKNSTTYTLTDVKDGIALFNLKGTGTMERKMEMQGMEMNVSSNSKSTGEMHVNAATGLLVKKVMVLETTGSVEVQGMTIPTTGKVTTTITVSEK